MRRLDRRGFTIVELLIVIVIIGILAALVIVAYNGMQQRAMETVLRSDLRNAATALEKAKVDNGDVYPSVFPSDFKTNSKVSINLTVTGDANLYCINGSYDGLSQIWRNEKNNGIQSGACSGQVVAGSDVGGSGTKINYVANPNFTSGWALNKATGTATATTRSGTGSDPAGNRPVLILQNVGAATSWSYIGGAMSTTNIMQAGRSYTTSYWIRVVSGTVSSNIGNAGVMDGGATNQVIAGGLGSNISTSWQKKTITQTAAINSLPSSKFYIYANTSSMTQNFTIELQDPRVEEQ